MAVEKSARAALIQRPASPGLGIFGVAGGLALVGIGIAIALGRQLPASAANYSAEYRASLATASMATAVWACLFASIGAWLIDVSLRAGFGLPRQASSKGVVVVRVLLAGFFILWLVKYSLLGDVLQYTDDSSSVDKAFVLALGVWGLVAFDLKDMIARGVALIAARLPALRATSAALAKLPARGLVKVSGSIVAGPRTLELNSAAGHDLVYLLLLAEDDDAKATPFLLSDGRDRVQVASDPRTRVITDPVRGSALELHVGQDVTVVGQVSGSAGDPYRAGLATIEGDDQHPLRVYAGDARYNRRLVIAATVELIAAAGMLAALGLLVSVWLGLR